jgi:ubiquinone biosynthesis protein
MRDETTITAGDDWSAFLDELDFGALVPEAYARYRPAVEAGLGFFLENLAAERAFALLADQAELPETATIEERLVAMARHCPALHKLGQVLARDRRLPESFRTLLQSLESMLATFPADEALAAIEAELGPLDRLGVAIDGPPLAEASVAVVVPYTWREHPDQPPRRGVFKLLKPGIAAKLTEELDLLQRVGALLDNRCEALGLPAIEYEETFLQVRDLLAREVHLDAEQEHMRAARAFYASLKSVVIPEVHPFSTPRLTSMQRIDGTKVTDAAALPDEVRRKLAGRIIEALIARPMWSSGDDIAFHADPHAGNLFASDDGRLAILDWSLTGTLGKSDRVGLTQVLFGAIMLDGGRIADAISELSHGNVDRERLAPLIAAKLQLLRDGMWPSIRWLTALMDEAATDAGTRFGASLVMFRKVLQTLDGVIGDVSADVRVDGVLALSLLRKLALEWRTRAYATPFAREFATHFSNMDLAQLWWSAPLIGSRYALALQSALLAPREGEDEAA